LSQDKLKLKNQNITTTRTIVLEGGDFAPEKLKPFLAKLDN